jgi:hypothetical protein
VSRGGQRFLLPLGDWGEVVIVFGKVLIFSLSGMWCRCLQGRGLWGLGSKVRKMLMLFLSGWYWAGFRGEAETGRLPVGEWVGGCGRMGSPCL